MQTAVSEPKLYACSMCQPKYLRGLFSIVVSLLSFDNIIKSFKLFTSLLLSVYLLRGCTHILTSGKQFRLDWNLCLARFGRKINTEKMVKPSNISSSFGITNQKFTFEWNRSIALSKQLNLSDTERPLIYSFMLIATAQLNDWAFVSYNCQQLHNEISKERRCWFVPEALLSVFFFDKSKWMASFILWVQCVCYNCTLRVDWLVGSGFWLCQAPQRYPEVNRYKSLIVFTWWKKISVGSFMTVSTIIQYGKQSLHKNLYSALNQKIETLLPVWGEFILIA